MIKSQMFTLLPLENGANNWNAREIKAERKYSASADTIERFGRLAALREERSREAEQSKQNSRGGDGA